ncbi:hypothetical protein C1752_00819 [Acaryochloris thomasi RCC1774]|uniref:Uncharacterized protein n=1 Tax=Acaryochloris thomasi RCC1774 TaxID=1764569 RepID=A0A2W1K5G5_9CYAN|nr:hypothetical protein C1752_00819 [Acaryochloris thomasi RCC1774]
MVEDAPLFQESHLKVTKIIRPQEKIPSRAKSLPDVLDGLSVLLK